ncbi:MAG TPA: putative glycoside hydrolase [Gemmatimonadaceae bacterium]|jgi:hypothetical protein|nr:putative glycoside hydrolase [Gemmatimonadaceae bacterium]
MIQSLTIPGVAMALSMLVCGAVLAQNETEGGPAPVRVVCAPDVARLCGDAKDLSSRVQCMDQHEDQLSEACRTARAGKAGGSAMFDSIAARITGREYPSIFAAWNLAENLRQSDGHTVPLSASESPNTIRARHDLFFSTYERLGLKLAAGRQYVVLTPEFTDESIQAALANRAKLLAANPNMLIMTDLHYFSAPHTYLPADSPWWLHDAKNARFEGNNTEYKSSRLDFSNPEFQDKVAALCAALLKTGVYDGCMMDWWHDDDQMGGDRLALIKKIRAVVGEKAILLANVNGRLPTRTANYLNGMYMEGFGAKFFPDWHTAAANLLWGETHLHKPAFTALEGWWRTGRDELPLMREVTTLALVFSDGYVLFSDPNELPTPDHLHDWYPFWDKSLGHPVGPPANLDHPDLNGAYTRQFDKGEVVFNPPSNHSVVAKFPEPRRSAATNVTGQSFTVAPGDGDLFLSP